MRLNRYALQALREARGYTVTELARMAGMSQSHLSNVESGARAASPKVIRSLADSLGVDTLAITCLGPTATAA